MESAFAKIEDLADHVRDYVNVKVEAVKLKAAAKSSKMISNLVAGLVVAVFFFLFIIFVSVSAAYALSAWIGKMYAGFLIIGGFYFLVGIIVWAGREKFLRIPIMNGFIRQLFKQEVDEED